MRKRLTILWHSAQYWLYRLVRATVFAGLRTRFRAEGAVTALRRHTSGGIVAANHIGIGDPIIITAFASRQIHWITAKEFATVVTTYVNYRGKYPHYPRAIVWLLSHAATWVVRSSPVILVDKDQAERGSVVRQTMRALQAGHLVGIFPQGRIHTDERDPDYAQLHTAFIGICRHVNVPIFPVRLEKDRRVIFHDPVLPDRHDAQLSKQQRRSDDNTLIAAVAKKILTPHQPHFPGREQG